MADGRKESHKRLEGFLSIEKKLQAIQQRQLSNCLMKILFECRPRVDLRILEAVALQAKQVQSSMLSGALASFVQKKTQSLLADALDRIETQSARTEAKILAGRILESLFARRRQAMQRVFLAVVGRSRREDLDNLCRGAFALYKLFLDHTKLQKYQFFLAGKRVFELERLSIPMQAASAGPPGRRLVKSNSLIMATTNNLRLGFYVLERKYVDQMKSTFQ